jgi:predicted transcriptional regulator
MAEQSKYAGVIADLRAERDLIDQTIALLERLAATGDVSGVTLVRTEPPHRESREIPDDAFFGMSIPDAIKKYLTFMKKKQPVVEISKALETGGLQHRSQNFYSTVYTVLSRLRERGEVVKVGDDWALAEWYGGIRRERSKTDSTKTTEDGQGRSEETDDAKTA